MKIINLIVKLMAVPGGQMRGIQLDGVIINSVVVWIIQHRQSATKILIFVAGMIGAIPANHYVSA